MSNLTFLYRNGDQCNSITGGWTSWVNYSFFSSTAAWVKFNDTNIELEAYGEVEVEMTDPDDEGDNIDWTYYHSHTYACAHTINAIDLTNIKTIAFVCSGDVRAYITKAPTERIDPVATGASQKYPTGSRTIDVSSMSGAYYICVQVVGKASNGGNGAGEYYDYDHGTLTTVYMDDGTGSSGGSNSLSSYGYVGIDNVARAIDGGYVGINNIARKIKFAYVGDADDVARLVWSHFPDAPTNEFYQLYYDGSDPSGLTGGFGVTHSSWDNADGDYPHSHTTYSFSYNSPDDSATFDTQLMKLDVTAGWGDSYRVVVNSNNRIDFTYLSSIEITGMVVGDCRYSAYGVFAGISNTADRFVKNETLISKTINIQSDYGTQTPFTCKIDCVSVCGLNYLTFGIDLLQRSVTQNCQFVISNIVAHVAFNPDDYIEFTRFTQSNVFIAPKGGYYLIELQGASGAGGDCACPTGTYEYAFSGGGGGGGGCAMSVVKLNKGDSVTFLGGSVSVDTTVTIDSSFENYTAMRVTPGKNGGEAGGLEGGVGIGSPGGIGSGGNILNVTGGTGSDGKRDSEELEEDLHAPGGAGGAAGYSGGNTGGRGNGNISGEHTGIGDGKPSFAIIYSYKKN